MDPGSELELDDEAGPEPAGGLLWGNPKRQNMVAFKYNL